MIHVEALLFPVVATFQILHVACIFQVQSEFLKVYKNFNGNDMTNGAILTTVNGATIKQILF